jgi:hypothetical protein
VIRPRSAPVRLALLIVVLSALYGVVEGLDLLSDAVFMPWVFAKPPLLDDWSGRLVAGNGDALTLRLTLRRASRSGRSEGCVRCSQIEGTAITCDAHGKVLRYRLSGSPRDRHGRDLHLGAVPEQQPPPDGLELDTLVGRWDGGDTLQLAADFFWRRGKSAISSTDDPATQPVPVTLSRGTGVADAASCRGQ